MEENELEKMTKRRNEREEENDDKEGKWEDDAGREGEEKHKGQESGVRIKGIDTETMDGDVETALKWAMEESRDVEKVEERKHTGRKSAAKVSSSMEENAEKDKELINDGKDRIQ
mgnify:CR=1 FL=1